MAAGGTGGAETMPDRESPSIAEVAKTEGSEARPPRSHGTLPGTILAFLGLALLLAGAAYSVWSRQAAEVIERTEADLAAVVRAKAQEVQDWQRERINDARMLLRPGGTRRSIERLLAGEALSGVAGAQLDAVLSTAIVVPHYDAVRVMTTDGRVVAEAGEPLRGSLQEPLRLMLQTGSPRFQERHLSEAETRPMRINLLMPIRGLGETIIGALVLRINPYLHFRPMLVPWPTASTSAAVLLVRRVGGEVVMLGPQGPARTVPAMAPQAPGLAGAQAVLERAGVFTGPDYRGEWVLAATHPVPMSPWTLIAKVDQAEVFAPLRSLAQQITGVSLLLLLAAGIATAVWREKQEADSKAFRLEAALRQQALTRHFDYLTKYANDLVLLTDAEGRIIEANDKAVSVYGPSRERLIGRPWCELGGGEPTPAGEGPAAPARLYESRHLRADGSAFPVEISARAIETDEQSFYQAIVRDISERKESEARIRRLANLYAALSQTNQAIVRIRDRDALLREICRVAVEYGQFRLAWIGMREGDFIRTAALEGEDTGPFGERTLALAGEGTGAASGLALAALREDAPQISNDLTTDPRTSEWQEARRLGLRSAVALPLRQAGQPVGVLAVYATEPDFFDAQLLQLLDEMALDVAFALDTIQSEAVRRAAEFRYRKLFDNMSSGVAVYRYRPTQDDFVIADVNKALERIERVSRADVVGRPLLEVFPGAAEFGIVAALHRVHQTGEPLYLEPKHYLDPRIAGWRENRLYLLPNGEVVAVYDDVTERVEAERALRASEERLRLVLEGSRDGFWDIDFRAGQAYYSGRFAEMFGYAPEELDAGVRGWARLVEPEDLPRVESELQAHLQGETPQYRSEHRMRTKSGRVLWVLARGAVVRRDANGQPLRMAGTHTDITDRKRAEEALRLWAKVSESSGEGIFITDSEQHIVLANRAFTRITGFSTEEVNGRDPPFLSSGRHDRAFYQKLWDSAREEGHWQGEILDRRKSGEVFPEWLSISAVYDEQGRVVNYVGLFSDITERKEAEARIDFLACHDLLTGLPNRRLLREQLERSVAHAQRAGTRLAVLTVDVDHFKTINDSLGHRAGDQLLQELGARLHQCVAPDDIVARAGGDEFVVVPAQIGQPTDAATLADCIRRAYAAPVRLDGTEVRITASVGISLFPDDGGDVDVLIRNSDAALYHAKEQGRNNLQFFIPELNLRARERLLLENSLRAAVDKRELILYYQPQVNTETESLVGVEALLRWRRPDGVLVPSEFVSLAEDSGIIVDVGEWVLREACRQQRALADEGMHILVAVNVSAIQFHRPDFPELLERVLKETGANPRCIELEVTEGILIRDVETTIGILQRLKHMGFTLAIDDFGTGYSSLNYLRRFPVDRLKVDQSFVRDMEVDPADRTITEAIIGLGKNLGMRVIAEGVETYGELAQLRALKCEDVQGYYFAHPMPIEELKRWHHSRGDRVH